MKTEKANLQKLRQKAAVFLQKLKRFLKEEEAATAVEYAVVLMLIAGSIIATIQALGGSTSAFFDANRDNIEQALDQQHF